MKITKRQLRGIIREALTDDDSYVVDDYWVTVRSPEAAEKFAAAGFMKNGESRDYSQGLGPLEMGMFMPQSQSQLDDQIQAAIEINAALMATVDALEADPSLRGEDAWYDIVYPVQKKWSNRGAADTEGRETSFGWLQKQGYEW